MDRSPKSVMRNDIKQTTNDDSLVDTNSSKKPDFGIDQYKEKKNLFRMMVQFPGDLAIHESNLISNILYRYYAQGF